MMPMWLHILAIVSLAAGFASAGAIAWDLTRRPQHMWIMNVVWPVTALYATLLGAWGYRRYGRRGAHAHMMAMQSGGGHASDGSKPPFAVMVGTGAAHCGAGCTLGDIIAEWLAFAFPVIAIWFGYQTLFAEKMFAVWVLDYIFAFGLGILFQYFTIAPMRGLSVRDGIIAALKADALSLTAWQVGMYGFMAVAQFWIFRRLLGVRLEVNSVEFWFMMQLAMIAGFITSYPVNWWLLKSGIKEPM
jgi:Domain of unknown function (DUF4396)